MDSNRLRSDLDGASRRPATLSTREAAAALGISEQAVRQAIARGTLAAGKRGRAYRIRQDELDRYAQRRLELHPAPRRGKIVALPTPTVAQALPTPATRFVGREAELAALVALLADPVERVVTVTGPGGVGKTRLALAAATVARDRFPDGVHFADLGLVTRPRMVVPAVAQALGLREQPGRDQRVQLAAFLQNKRVLLVLDNFEQILEAAPEVAWIVARAPELSVLVTSRAPLRIGGERVLPVPPLSLAGAAATADEVLASDAGRLFVERAREHDPSFAIDAESAPLVADICSRLDGLPLAIELAAARSRVLSPHQLRDRLERRLPLLTHGARDAPGRQRTMRDAIAWSYDHLAPPEQRCFRRLAVFAGGCTLEAAATVLRLDDADHGDDPAADVLEPIGALVDQSLFTPERGPDGEPRFRMLETIREFGLERIGSDEETAARSVHARFYRQFVQVLRPLTNTQATRIPLDRLAADDANVRAALGWSNQHGRHADVAAMVASCWLFWYALGRLHEAESWLTRALNRIDEASDADGARLLIAYAELLMVKGDATSAETAFTAALPSLRAAGDPFDLAMALIAYGASLNYGGRYADAEPHLREAFATAERIADATLRAAVAGGAQSNLSDSARGQGDLALAAERSEHALRWYRGQDFDLAEPRALLNLAEIARDQGDHLAAVERYLAYLAHIGERGEVRLLADALAGIASTATAWRHYRTAVLLFGAADAVRGRAGVAMVLPIDAALEDHDRATLRETMDDREFDVTLETGRALPLVDAVALAAAMTPLGSGLPVSSAEPRKRLTPREREILILLAESRTDREIGETIFLSPRTVNWHVRAILAKLGAASRREAVHRARAEGVITS